MARRVILVKLGGSLVTDKRRSGRARSELIARLAREIASATRRAGAPRLIVGHGSGSFGHVAAARAGLTRGADATRRLDGIARVQRRAADLHQLVMAALERAGARPFSLAPGSFMTARNGRVTRVFADPLFEALERGLLPVVFGDVVLDATRGATIVSTEEVFLRLAREAGSRGLTVSGAVWLGETDGIRGDDGKTVVRLAASESARRARRATGASGTDVTGGISLRLTAAARLARLGVPSWVVDGRRRGALAAAIAGRTLGTLIAASV